MFRLLSKESNIFSIPVYIGFLFLLIIYFNIMNINTLSTFSAILAFAGVSLGYFLFNKIGLNYQSHLPLFMYTFFIFAMYPENLDVGISAALLTNSFLLLLLTSSDENLSKKSYVLAGAILAINYLFLPTTWPLVFFVIFHIVGTSQRILLNIFRLFFGIGLILATYLGIMYFLGCTAFNPDYFPKIINKPLNNLYPYTVLIPIILMILFAVVNHFQHFNEKSPSSRFKYSFLLIFSLAQLTTILLYMGKSQEYLLLLALPASIILSRYLRFLPKYWMRELGLWLIIVTLILYKVATYYDLGKLFFV